MTTQSYDYIRNPEEIYRRSFAIIRAEVDLGGLPPDLEAVAVRLIHACGMPDIVQDLTFSNDAAARGRRRRATLKWRPGWRRSSVENLDRGR